MKYCINDSRICTTIPNIKYIDQTSLDLYIDSIQDLFKNTKGFFSHENNK